MIKLQKSQNYISLLMITGLALNTVGSLLPWRCYGDLIDVCEPGIVIPYLNGFRFGDHGGLFVLSLSLLIFGLVSYQPGFLRKPSLWALASAVILLIYTIIELGPWIYEWIQIQHSGITGAPTPTIGLGSILIGSIFLLLGTKLHSLL